MRQSMKFARNACALLFLLLLASGILPITFWLSLPLVDAQPPHRVDAIVILGGGVIDTQTLGLETADRLLHGLRIYKQGYAPIVVLSGGNAEYAGLAEADVMARAAIELGVPSSALLIDRESDRTRAEALAVARLAQESRLRSIVLVTSPWHTYRARRAFQKVGFEVTSVPPVPLKTKTESIVWRADAVLERIGKLAPVLREYAAIALYWWCGWI